MKQYKNKKTGEIIFFFAKKKNVIEYYRFSPYIKKQVLCSDLTQVFNNKFEEIKSLPAKD
jgi:hypothetical protein